jgi:hypothetical protein
MFIAKIFYGGFGIFDGPHDVIPRADGLRVGLKFVLRRRLPSGRRLAL